MVAVPIIYFTILSFILYFRHKKIDFACYTTIIYAVSGFFSILIDFYKLRGFDTCNYKISFGATFTYCFLLTLLLIPITIYSNARIKEIQQIRNEKLLKGVAWLFGLYFIFYAIISFSSIYLNLYLLYLIVLSHIHRLHSLMVSNMLYHYISYTFIFNLI